LEGGHLTSNQSRVVLLSLTLTSGSLATLSACRPSGSGGSDFQGNAFTEKVAGKEVTLQWPSKTIPVCWEDHEISDKAEIMRAVQQTVHDSYSELGFAFTGWGVCQPSSQGIRIAIDNTAAHPMTRSAAPAVPGAGRQLDGVVGGMILHTEHRDRNQYGICLKGPSAQRCTLIDAVHEFGHVLGLAHEHARADSDCVKPGDHHPGGMPNAMAIGAYDPKSIMNSCYTNRALETGDLLQLSAGDKAALNQLYRSAPDLPANNESSVSPNSNTSVTPGHNNSTFGGLASTELSGRCAEVGGVSEITYPDQAGGIQSITYCRCQSGKLIIFGRVPTTDRCT